MELRWLIMLLVTVSIVTTSSVASAQDSIREIKGAGDNWYFGYTGFRMLLEERGLEVRRDLAHSLSTPRESVVVMFGDLSTVTRSEWLRVRRYVDQGGTLLVASEKAFTLPGVSSFNPGPVYSRNSADRYQNFQDCLGLTSLNADHPLSQGLREIIVNRSGWLSTPEDDSLTWDVIVSLPDDCFPVAAREKPVILVGMDPEPNRGVMILAADQSLFSDGMLWHGENSILAIQTSDLLCRGNRKWLTVMNNGQTLSSYRTSPSLQPPAAAQSPPPQIPPIPPGRIDPPKPSMETMLKAINAVVKDVEESNVLNETLKNRPRNVRPVAWLRTMLLILIILATLFVLWKLVQKKSFQFPVRYSRFMQSMYGVNSAKQLAASEFGSAVEVLARDLCREITGSSVQTDWLKLLSGGRGSAVSALPFPLQQGLSELLGIATRGCRIHISRRKFQAIGRTVQELRNRHRAQPILKAGATSPASSAPASALAGG